MYESDDIAKAAGAVASWQAFAADERTRMAHELALSARCDQLFPLRPFAEGPQPTPLHFYGPGPEGSLHPYHPPVGTLHFARWRHEIAAFVDPNGFGYYHEEHPMILNGHQIRPTYTTKGTQLAREVNYFRWERVPAELLRGVKTYPGPETTRAVHDEYLLNQDDFNDFDTERRKVRIDLDNRQDEDPKAIYPLGYKLLKKWSRVNGFLEWTEGTCLGADPFNSGALTKHIGWFPKRLRRTKAGLGADPQDAVWKEVFHGNLDVKSKENFIPPKDKWSEDPSKVTVMTSPGSIVTFDIVSLEVLTASLPRPDADTLSSRKTWLEAHAITRRPIHQAKTDAENPATCEQHTRSSAESDLESIIQSTEKLVVTTMAGQRETTEITACEEGTESTEQAEVFESDEEKAKATSHEDPSTTWNAAAEEREAIQATLDELSRNPEPGKEGKIPILAYSAFRSRFLGTPVTQILGYE